MSVNSQTLYMSFAGFLSQSAGLSVSLAKCQSVPNSKGTLRATSAISRLSLYGHNVLLWSLGGRQGVGVWRLKEARGRRARPLSNARPFTSGVCSVTDSGSLKA